MVCAISMKVRENSLFAVRHGLTEWARDGKHTSYSDIPLLPEGEKDALSLDRVLHHRPFAVVLTSPRKRAQHTAELAGYADAIVDEDLVEWNYGDDEGITSDQIRQSRPGWDMWRDGFGGTAETLDQVVARADRIIERVLAADGDTLAFAHAHFLRVLVARWIEQPGILAQRFTVEPASTSELGWKDHRRVIHRWNDHVD
jgi:broad specificity phosphatase PhoE